MTQSQYSFKQEANQEDLRVSQAHIKPGVLLHALLPDTAPPVSAAHL